MRLKGKQTAGKNETAQNGAIASQKLWKMTVVTSNGRPVSSDLFVGLFIGSIFSFPLRTSRLDGDVRTDKSSEPTICAIL